MKQPWPYGVDAAEQGDTEELEANSTPCELESPPSVSLVELPRNLIFLHLAFYFLIFSFDSN